MQELERLASLIRDRNAVEIQITKIIGRPAQIGHIGEFIAAKVFDIDLVSSASNKGFDGQFRQGPIAGSTVNIKWYAKLEWLLDVVPGALPDYYLVMTGPSGGGFTSKGSIRPWLIEGVYLFEATKLVDTLTNTGTVKIGIATSVRRRFWDEAEIFPRQVNQRLVLSDDQRAMLSLFASELPSDRNNLRLE